ncbi:MAG: hypothetical protein OES18_21000, partial [Deltaproteobacteria bacterium]|nr:hypothetical protein [Deltaproteobacteria bacterium]
MKPSLVSSKQQVIRSQNPESRSDTAQGARHKEYIGQRVSFGPEPYAFAKGELMARKGKKKPRLLQGNEAIVEGALAAGCSFFAGYPITPASEISEILAYRLPQVEGTFIQMEDEIASLGAVIGASLAGAKSMT